MSILVSGGAGYVGSHACVELIEAGYDVIVADNLVNASREAVRRVEQITGKAIPFVQADLCDPAAVEEIFEQFPSIDAVMHFAALKAVGESVRKPLEYYANNLGRTLVLLEGMRTHGVKKFVFSSSATVYGDPAPVPIREDALLSATNPYGYTKLFIEQILTDCGFYPEEMKEILYAIENHRNKEMLKRDDLAGILYRADKMSRCCFGCRAEKECNWSTEKKNMEIQY